ncbi:DUF6456 domain-containing protein [Candidatus Halocynthiibacter alkanivorans]|uniref:DUF6456 domain-containing protein n=1 Tax=Candidatus Halocynthiibacter alkanivorans TaxID=2267619 RepID=UPI000DF301CE|nr:DUF6456 domain-containing protein [Candidatus Halocynthiibacter alkanivorans]
MNETVPTERLWSGFPAWVPQEARRYLGHTKTGMSLRELARKTGCHASTVLRQVRKTEARRDDPLIDQALTRLGRLTGDPCTPDKTEKDFDDMNIHAPKSDETPDKITMEREARRVLRRMSESEACLAVARDMEKAVVVRDLPGGKTTRTAIVERAIAEAMALKDWISCPKPGRISRYRITPAGRAALKRMLYENDTRQGGGFAETQNPFGEQHRLWGDRLIAGTKGAPARRMRYNVAENPVLSLSRRRDKDGKYFLSADLVAVAERLREDFELAQMGPRVAQNWERFLTGAERGTGQGSDPAGGPSDARARVAAALADLGPGLGDVALRCCCFLEGMETAEKRLGWSARSGKIVLRIALLRLKRHYKDSGQSNLIG